MSCGKPVQGQACIRKAGHANLCEPDRLQLRMQVADANRLVAEVVAERSLFEMFGFHLATKWAQARHRVGKSAGSIVICRADLPRVWDVPVGSMIREADHG